jgi:hypothetical protein
MCASHQLPGWLMQQNDGLSMFYELQAVLYGIFPVMAAGMGVSYLRLAWLMRPVDKFRNPPPGIKLKKIHRWVPGACAMCSKVTVCT